MKKPVPKQPTVKVSYTPLTNNRTNVRSTDSSIRAENEDDDGYDPYSDRRELPPLFEQHPWD